MNSFKIAPEISTYDTVADFVREFPFTSKDLVLASKRLYEKYLEKHLGSATFIDFRSYFDGEPTSRDMEKMQQDLSLLNYDRVIGIGGGSILDVSKLLVIDNSISLEYLFMKKVEPHRTKELILIPTTCGTGSEVTNISVLAIESLATKYALAHDALFANHAVMIFELLNDLPYDVFAASSLDALTHAIESFLSPLATPISLSQSRLAIELLLENYLELTAMGTKRYKEKLSDFLMASLVAGYAFGNSSCGPVHGISYPLGTKYHVPHGESNYTFLVAVLKQYQALDDLDGESRFDSLKDIVAKILQCPKEQWLESLENMLLTIIPIKRLSTYEITLGELGEFTDSVYTNQKRLLGCGYLEFNRDHIYEIYQSVF